MEACPQLDPAVPVAERLAAYLDCHAEHFGQDGFAHLSGGWFGQAILVGALTIFVALIGYRLLLGQAIGPRAALLAALRAGAVIAFATSWPAYDAVVYGLLTDGPAELASQILPADVGPLPLIDAARRVDSDLSTLQGAGPSRAEMSSAAPGPQLSADHGTSAPALLSRDSPLLDLPGLVLLTSTVGIGAALRVAAGVLLGFGPIFVILALFDSTVGVFEGWIRALLATFLGTAGAIAVTSLELDFIESGLIAPFAGIAGVNRTSSLLPTSVLFANVMVVILILAAVVSRAFRLRGLIPSTPVPANVLAISHRGATHVRTATADLEAVSRARSVADAVLRLGRREAVLDVVGGSGVRSPSPLFDRIAQASGSGPTHQGQATRRRPASSTGSLRRRDKLT